MRDVLRIGFAILCLTLVGQAPAPRPPATGSVQGRVDAFFGGKDYNKQIDELWVYLEVDDRYRSAGEPGKQLVVEMPQRSKQFTPRVLVVPLGATVYFPNKDSEVHSVFSPAGKESVGFELDRFEPKAKGPPKQFKELGEFDIYCDIHPNMSAKVKVVPLAHAARVAGTKYKLDGVVPGRYRVVAWAPNSLEVRSQPFEVKAGASYEVETLNLQYRKGPARHLRKDGSEYGPYTP
jgi:plastocyanin